MALDKIINNRMIPSAGVTHMIRLMIKTHNKTGLKYLCKTEKENWKDYLGSGIYWLKHLEKYGPDISTELLYETTDKHEFKSIATQKSIELNVVQSKEWANQKHEEGDGGNTVGGRKWITDGINEKYQSGSLPAGWYYGRSATCKFKNKDFQKQMTSRVDRKKSGNAIRQAWAEGRVQRDHSKCGRKGDLNPAKRPEVRKKIKAAALLDSQTRSERMKKVKPWEARWKKS